MTQVLRTARALAESVQFVHCKTCRHHDPYQIITWVPPEGVVVRITMGVSR